MPRQRLTASALLLVLLLQPLPVHAQLEKLVETIEVRVTNVDVVVTDRAGHPIVGLTRDDFLIYENKKPQTITNFYEVRPQSVNVSPKNEPGGEKVVEPEYNEPPASLRRRRIVFFIDNYSLHPFKRNEIFTSMEKYFDRLFQYGDEATIVSWNRGIKVVTPFTTDALALKDALRGLAKQNAGGPPIAFNRDRLKQACTDLLDNARNTRGGNISEAYAQSLSMVRAYADEIYFNEKSLTEAMRLMLATLGGLEGKKVMVFAGAQLPEKPAMDMFQWVDQLYNPFIRNLMPSAVRESSERSAAPLLDKVARQANSDGVTMYMIDAADSSKGNIATAESNEQIDNTVEFMEYTNTANAYANVARMTGGVGLVRTNNFDLAMQTVARDLGAYYSLGYKSDDKSESERSIVVKTKNPEFRVRSRRSYVAKSNDQQTNDRVVANVFHGALKGEMAVTLKAGAPIRQQHGLFKVPVTISFPSDITLLPDGDQLVGGFTVFFAVGDLDGSLSPVTRRPQPIRIPKGAEKAMRSRPISFTAEILVRPGEHFLSVGIVDQIASTAGYARTKVIAR